MSEINPYQSPQCPEPLLAAELIEPAGGGVWREGKLLVMHKRATLPDRCVKSNQPAHGRRLKRNLYWHPWWVYFTILIHLLVYIILALVLRKHAVIHIGLSSEWFAKRRRATLIGWGSVVVALALVVTGVVMLDGHFETGIQMIAASPFPFFGGAIYGLVAARMVAPKRITNDYVWLKGVHPDYLAELPPWPYPS